ncbi:MAG: Ig-like domain-containing protein [Aggregatilineales bacterium]
MVLKKRIILIAMLMCVAGILNFPLVNAQSDLPVPRLIDFLPNDQTPLALDAPILLTFNLSMNQASVENAFTIAPEIAGEFIWQDARTVLFMPTNGWQRGTSYDVTISESASSTGGRAFDEPFTFDFETTGALHVLSVSPENNARDVVARNQRISVTFDRPVVPVVSSSEIPDLLNPITIEPAIEGVGEWINSSIYTFTPNEVLQGSTRYTITIAAGLTAVDGSVLTEDYVSTFETLPPQVLDVIATERITTRNQDIYWYQTRGVLLNSHFQVTFSQPMDRESTEEAFALYDYGPAFWGHEGYSFDDLISEPLSFEWNDDYTVITLIPADELLLTRLYFVHLSPTAHTRDGEAVFVNAVASSFVTISPPHVTSTNPSSRTRPGLQRVSVAFNTRINTSTYEGRYTVSPEPAGGITPYVTNSGSLELEFEHENDTVYTITILAGVEDIFGNPLEYDYTFSYAVQEHPQVSSARLAVNHQFAIAGLYRDIPQIPLSIWGEPTVNFRLFRTDIESLSHSYSWNSFNTTYNYGYYERLFSFYPGMSSTPIPPWVKEQNLLRSWESSFIQGGEGSTSVYEPLHLEGGARLPIGLYGVEVSTSVAYGNRIQGFLVAVTNTNITVVTSPGESLIWLTDFVTGEPVADATVVLHSEDGQHTLGQSDEHGLVTVAEGLLSGETFSYVTAHADGIYGAWYTGIVPATPQTQQYIYTDRPIYRPGETVYFRGMLRDRDDMTYTVPDVDTVYARIDAYGYQYIDPDSESYVYQAELPVSEFGTFSDSFTLPDDMLYNMSLFVSNCQPQDDDCEVTYSLRKDIILAEFRVPEYEIEVAPQSEEIIAGDPLNIAVNANYYHGGGVSDGQVTWQTRSAYGSVFRFSGEAEDYRFGDEQFNQGSDRYSQFPSMLNTSGEFLITEPAIAQGRNILSMQVEATVTDLTGQSISASTTVTIHPANVYVGMQTEQTFGSGDQPFAVNILTITPDSEILPDQVVEMEVTEIRWIRDQIEFGRYQWHSEEINVTQRTLSTDDDGQAQFVFQPPNAGIFRIRATTYDDAGRVTSSTIRVYAQDENDEHSSGVWWGTYSTLNYPSYYYPQSVALTANATTYVPGDTAEIFIPNPYNEPVSALVMMTRNNIIEHEVIHIDGDALVYSFPIRDIHAPSISFSVLLIRPISKEHPDPTYIRGGLNLRIEPVARRIHLEITPSQDIVAPGDVVSFHVRATDQYGDPVVGEVGLSLTDEAALDIYWDWSPTLEETYYATWQRNYVSMGISIYGLLTVPLDENLGGGNGGGGCCRTGPVRDNLVYTPLWEPHVVTDDNGEATVTVQMPDNLTRWRLDARAVTTDTMVGQAQINITSTLPIVVQAVAPRFFVAGDYLPVAAAIINNTDDMQMIEVNVEVDGIRLDDTETVRRFTLAPHTSERIEWMGTVEDVAGVDIVVSAITGMGYQDAARPALRTNADGTIPVYRFTTSDTVRTTNLLDEAETVVEAISLPTRFSEIGGTLTIQTESSLAVTILETFEYLRHIDPRTSEVRISQMLPALAIYQALNGLTIDDSELREQAQHLINQAITQLQADQNVDGGWGWHSTMRSDPYISAYAFLGLTEALRQGFTVDASIIDFAAAYLMAQLPADITLNTPDGKMNLQAFNLYVLARNHNDQWVTIEQLDDLYEFRIELSTQAHAYLLMAYLELDPEHDAIDALVSDLTSTAILTATGAHWEENDENSWVWNSDTQTTSIALAALLRARPNYSLAPNVVRWLMIARRGDHWLTTQENTWAISALSEWMMLNNELQGDYSYDIQLNDEPLLSSVVNSDTIGDAHSVEVNIDDLEDINYLNLSRGDGEGVLYYDANLTLQLPADEVQAVDRGIFIKREYLYVGEEGEIVVPDAFEVGRVVTIRLNISVSQDTYYFMLEDTLPSGMEILDRRLLTTSQAVQDPQLFQIRAEDPHWYWGNYYLDVTELSDEGIYIFADFLPAGSYIFTYQVQATHPGQFQAIPTQASAYFQPEIFGHSDGQLISIVGLR